MTTTHYNTNNAMLIFSKEILIFADSVTQESVIILTLGKKILLSVFYAIVLSNWLYPFLNVQILLGLNGRSIASKLNFH